VHISVIIIFETLIFIKNRPWK